MAVLKPSKPGEGVLPLSPDGTTAEAEAPLGQRVSLHHTVAVVFLLDCLIIVLGGFAPVVFERLFDATRSLDFSAEALFIAALFFQVSQRMVDGYKLSRIVDLGKSTRRAVFSLFVAFSILIMVAAAAKVTHDYSRVWFFSWMTICLLLVPLQRWVVIGRLRRSFATGAYVHRALSVGVRAEPLDQSAIARLSHGQTRILKRTRIGVAGELLGVGGEVRQGELDEVYVTVAWPEAQRVFDALSKLQHLPANIYVHVTMEDGEAPLLGAAVHDGGLQVKVVGRAIEGWDSWQKRLADLVIAYGALLILSPVLLLVALAIRLESPGPVLFRQLRQGFNGRTFELLKFRSMYSDRLDAHAARQTSRGDDRVTRVGRFIRRTSLDELPQLVNVICGDMSIVGPRPHALMTTAEGHGLDNAVREYALRHRVKPGMTGWAQVNGLRGELDSIEKLRRRVEHDIAYIDGWSMEMDLKIILRTLWIVVADRTAY